MKTLLVVFVSFCLVILTIFQGVVNCVTSLVMALAQDHTDVYALCYQKAVDRMYRVRNISTPNVND